MRFPTLLLTTTLVSAATPKFFIQSFSDDQVWPGSPGSPPSKPHPLPDENQTIFQQLNGDPEFSRLAKAINISEKVVSLLNDSSASISFFAVPNRALPHPHQQPKLLFPENGDDLLSLSETILALERLDLMSNDDSEGRKRFFKKILEAIIAYHILPSPFDLSSNTTFPTNLTFPGAHGDQAQRIKVHQTLFPPITAVNLRSMVVRSNIKAKNGVVHVIDHPLLPPPSLFTELFMASTHFSIFTSALLNSGIKDDLHLRFGKNGFEGSSAVSVFAPSNRAFHRLPKRLKFFLFSPFGARALQKLLQYHVVPEYILHSDYLYKASSGYAGSHVEKMHDFEQEMPMFDEYISTEELMAYDADMHDLRDFRPGGRLRPVFMENGAIVEMPPYPWIQLDMHRIIEQCMSNATIDSVKPCVEKHKLCPHNADSPLSRPPHLPTLISAVNLTVPTLLENHTLSVHIARYNVTRPLRVPGQSSQVIVNKVSVNGRVIPVTDIVAMNGALHVTGHLLDPRPIRHKSVQQQWDEIDDDVYWEDWEDWLPQWAMED